MIKISVAIGQSAEAKIWKNRTFVWADFVEKLRTPVRTHERYADYVLMPKPEQGKIKDVGGYVCGYLTDSRRGKANVKTRSALTLDLDFSPYDLWPTITMIWDCAAVLHSTHKHSKTTPRYRLIVPLDREVTPDEYIAIARKFAQTINIEYFDPTTFDINRLMFWPSVANDGEYVFEEQRGEPLCADRVLRMYRDWTDASSWAYSKKFADNVRTERGKKQADPLEKDNIVGYFCNAYSIHDAIAEFLPDVYESCGNDRYTYLSGSTAAGVLTYDDLFAYSHHGTDPASGSLCNAFDLVRIHKFGASDAPGAPTKSYKLMQDFCRTLAPVKRIMSQSIIRDFAEYSDAIGSEVEVFDRESPKRTERAKDVIKNPDPGEEPCNDDWLTQMDVNKQNEYEASERNFALILRNDPRLKGILQFNEFSHKKMVARPLPGDKKRRGYPRRITDTDYSAIRSYIGHVYGISHKFKLEDEIALELQRNGFNPVVEWLESLEWDGVPRLDTLLRDCFAADDNAYVREVSRKWLVAAVARAMNPGCKYDTIISLVGEEGTRKSSFLRKLGGEWFSDSFTTVEGNKAYEQVIGRLIIEIAELSAFDKSETAMIKHFVTKQSDTYRPAYGHEDVEFKRTCVFAATSNNRAFLRMGEGNRRFWPIDVKLSKSTGGKIDPASSEFDKLVPQIWAEAVVLWRLDESLILSAEAERAADDQRTGHVEMDSRQGIIKEYLEMEVPANWSEMCVDTRRDFIQDPILYRGREIAPRIKRKRICVAEIWCECFGKRKEDLTLRHSREISTAVSTIPGWKWMNTTYRFKHYGTQRYYEQINE